MVHFWKHLFKTYIWLLLSEILCLILGFSVALLRSQVVVYGMGLLFGAAAHILLIASCAQKIADEDVKLYRTAHFQIKIQKPLLISICAMLPAYLTCVFLLWLHPNSDATLNLFPLLNAPFIQYYRILIQNTAPFSALTPLRQFLMHLPPVTTAAAWFIGYQHRYIPETAKLDAKTPRT